jgi:hypothetical protein
LNSTYIDIRLGYADCVEHFGVRRRTGKTYARGEFFSI